MTYDAERLRELLLRLVGPEPKASHVSASETHEIADGCIELLDEVEKLRAGLSELESLRKWCKASIDADGALIGIVSKGAWREGAEYLVGLVPVSDFGDAYVAPVPDIMVGR